MEPQTSNVKCQTGNFIVRRISLGPYNYLFGFHDLVQTNAKGDMALALEVEDISHPPLPGETCRAGIIDLFSTSNSSSQISNFRALHETHTWNYPQGARQQWIGDSDFCVCNDREEDGRLVCRVSDAREGKVVDTLPFPVHCADAKTRRTFGINYDRVHACGGYGYTPNGKMKCPRRIVDIPTEDGIFVGNLDDKTQRLLVSIAQVAACGEKSAVKTGYPHYLTHLMLNPSGTRLAFLHRYRVVDGGEPTRLMTVGTDGSGLRCLAKGFLSHFTWTSDDTLFIWGREERALCTVREKAILRVPGVVQCAMVAKSLMRLTRSLRGRRPSITSKQQQVKFFNLVTDSESPKMTPIAAGVLTEDGHPMARPGNLNWVVSDTYPDERGDRWLYFYNLKTNERVNVAQYRRLFATPDISAFDWRSSQKGLDVRILKKFNREDYLFYRSGYHTDLHPRWSCDGDTAFFDSIHEGSRQVYQVCMK